MLKKLILAVLLLAVIGTVFAQGLLPVNVERKIPAAVEPGKTAEVTINIKLNGFETDSVIVTETIPAGWEMLNPVPEAYEFGEQKFKWLLYNNLDNAKITYTLKAPASFNEAKIISGTWKTLEGMGLVEGDRILNVAVPEPEPTAAPSAPPAPTEPEQDYTLLVIGAVIAVLLIAVLAVLVMKKK